jgi:hypothetical protein
MMQYIGVMLTFEEFLPRLGLLQVWWAPVCFWALGMHSLLRVAKDALGWCCGRVRRTTVAFQFPISLTVTAVLKST